MDVLTINSVSFDLSSLTSMDGHTEKTTQIKSGMAISKFLLNLIRLRQSKWQISSHV